MASFLFFGDAFSIAELISSDKYELTNNDMYSSSIHTFLICKTLSSNKGNNPLPNLISRNNINTTTLVPKTSIITIVA